MTSLLQMYSRSWSKVQKMREQGKKGENETTTALNLRQGEG